MSLAAGARLGPYDVVAPLGEGGMGAVYRARDTTLNRDVALKVLLPDVANDPERLARFRREAQVLASLTHPNIGAIHTVEDASGVVALVMELVEGEDLSHRIARGPIPLDEALPIAKQIAEALEAAHEQGIVHRDLKPANIKVRNDGTVKVLDFGLAKALESNSSLQSPASSLSLSPTITSPAPMTGVGVILGTAAYMAPEQARGRAVDKRADIWAFGCVLYEMLSAKQAFAGEDVADVLSRVLQREPDWTALPATTPSSLRRLGSTNSTSSVVISPDGTRIAWIHDDGTPPKLFTRRLDQTEATELAGTDGAMAPRFSPDGRWIAFAHRGTFSKVSVDGGAVVSLGRVGAPAGVLWNDPEHILVSEGFERGLLRVPANGGPFEQVEPLPKGLSAIANISMLPDNEHILFSTGSTSSGGASSIEVLTLSDKGRKSIASTPNGSPRFLETGADVGHLIYNTQSTLFAMPFDAVALEPRGAAVPIVNDVAYTTTGTGQFDVSRTGTLVYSRMRSAPVRTVQWLDPSGKTQPVVASPGAFQSVSLSPDGLRVALTADDGFTSDIWVYDLKREVMTRATSTGNLRGAAWSSDGKHLAVSAFLRGMAQTTPDGSAQPAPLLPGETSFYPGVFTPDGTQFVYVDVSTRKIVAVPVEEQGGQLKAGAPVLVTDDSAAQRPALSPDGRWLAYQSNASGRFEVYVRPFSGGASSRDRRYQISTESGQSPRWSRDGKRLVYQDDDRLMSVTYTVNGDTFVADRPTVWIAKLGVPEVRSEGSAWDLSPDGTRALVIRPVDDTQSSANRHVVFLQNFFDELRRRAPLPE